MTRIADFAKAVNNVLQFGLGEVEVFQMKKELLMV